MEPQHNLEDASPKLPQGRAAIPWRPVGRRREGTFEKRLRRCVENVTGTGPPVPPPHPQVDSRVVEAQPCAAALTSPGRGEAASEEPAMLWAIALEQQRVARRLRVAATLATRQSRAAELRVSLREVRERSREETRDATRTLTAQARQQRREKLYKQLERADPLASLRRSVPSDRLPVSEPPPEGRPRRLAPLNAPKPSSAQRKQVDKLVGKIRRLDRNEAWEKRRERRQEAQRHAQAQAASEGKEGGTAAPSPTPAMRRPLEGQVPRHIIYGTFRGRDHRPPDSAKSPSIDVHALLRAGAAAAGAGRTEEAFELLRNATLATTGQSGNDDDAKERSRLRVAALNDQACLSMRQGDTSQALELLGVLRSVEQTGGLGEDPRALYNLSLCQEGNGALDIAFGTAKRAEKLARKEIRKRTKGTSPAQEAMLDPLRALVAGSARQQARLQAKSSDVLLGSPRSGYRRAVKVAKERLGTDHAFTLSLVEEARRIEVAMQRDDKRQFLSKLPVSPIPSVIWMGEEAAHARQD